MTNVFIMHEIGFYDRQLDLLCIDATQTGLSIMKAPPMRDNLKSLATFGNIQQIREGEKCWSLAAGRLQLSQ